MVQQVIEIYERLKNMSREPGKRVYIRGAGTQGAKLKYELECLRISVCAFLDADAKKQTETVCGLPVYDPSHICGQNPDDIYIICSMMSDDAYVRARMDMLSQGLSEGEHFADFGAEADRRMLGNAKPILSMEPVYADREKALRDNIKWTEGIIKRHYPEYVSLDLRNDETVSGDALVIGSLALTPTTYCTLRCKNCVICVPYFKQPRHFDPDALIGDVAKILKVARIVRLSILGGETFAHPGLAYLLDKMSRMEGVERVGSFRIITNGTILPATEIMTQFKKLAFPHIEISNYGALSHMKDELAALCAEHHLPCDIYPSSFKWVDLGDFTEDRGYTQQELERLFDICDSGLCVQLHNGKLFTCARAAALDDMNVIADDGNAYLDIRGTRVQTLRDDLCRYMYDAEYYEACRSCGGNHPGSKEILPAIQAD